MLSPKSIEDCSKSSHLALFKASMGAQEKCIVVEATTRQTDGRIIRNYKNPIKITEITPCAGSGVIYGNGKRKFRNIITEDFVGFLPRVVEI